MSLHGRMVSLPDIQPVRTTGWIRLALMAAALEPMAKLPDLFA